jgi:signal transduction histidine kinase
MMSSVRSWTIARQIALLIAAALFLLSAGNMVVTFAGPPPRAAPFRLSDIPPLIRGGGRLPPDRQLAMNGYAPDFSARPNETRRPAAEARLAAMLGAPADAVRVATSQQMRPPPPGSARLPEQFEGNFSIGLAERNGLWHILRSAPAPLFTAWHRTTLVITLTLAALLALIAAGITKGIVRPIRRLAEEADQVWLDGRRGAITIGGPPEVAHLARTIAAMRDRFANVVENRTMMLAAIAHDMASPLTRLEFQVAKLPDATRREAEADLAELSAMISSILDFAKGQQRLHSEPVDLVALIRDVIARRDRLDAPLGMEIAPAAAWVRGDQIALRRLVDNLASNAQRYAGGGLIEVETHAQEVRLVMLDDGPGFPPELSERLFEPFFRIEASRNRDTAGTGLGLATARAIAEAHGGTLEARNRPVAGAIFLLTLPALEGALDPR